MGCLKRLIGIVLFIGGLIGCLYYFAPALFSLDPSTGASVINFITKYLTFLTNNYNNLIAQTMFGFASPLMMFIISFVVLIIGLFLAK